MQANQPRQLTCFKCGKHDHWSRDCTVPPSEWIQRNQSQNTDQAARTGGSTGLANGKENTGLRSLTSVRSTSRKPKLEMRHFQDPRLGLPLVFLTFKDKFKKVSRGRGHEGSDLKRLLEMYRDWQKRLLPGMDLDDFIAAAEKLGNTNMMKKEMRELRSGAIDVLADEDNGPVAGDDMIDVETRTDRDTTAEASAALDRPAAANLSSAGHTEANEDDLDAEEDFEPFDEMASPDPKAVNTEDMAGVSDELMEEFY